MSFYTCNNPPKLSDENSLVYYGVQKESTLFLKIGQSMKIYVEKTPEETITLDVLPSETIETIKAEIYEKEGIPVNQQNLFFDE